jgi:hypothetical protein
LDDPIQEETDKVALMVAGRGMEAVQKFLTKPNKTLAQIKATLTTDNPHIPPPRRPRRDVSFPHFILFLIFIPEWLRWRESLFF